MTPMQRIGRLIAAAMLVLSALLCVAISYCFWRRPDWCAAVTFWPAWLWLAPGLGLALLGFGRRRVKWFIAVVALWLLFLVLLGDEPRALLRVGAWPSSEWRAARPSGRALRVVSLNCSGGSTQAAAEVVPYHPDIVLLQETLERKDTERLARRLFGKRAGIARGVDTDVIADGRVVAEPRKGLPPFAYVQAHVRLTSGIRVDLFCVHFLPPVLDFAVWSPACWRDHAEKRQVHLMQAREIAHEVDALPLDLPVIVGGDLNVPGGDGALRVLAPRLRDAFDEGGRGWGDTVINDMPVSRFDQVWVSRQFEAAAVVARETKHSDHRLVICDLILRHTSEGRRRAIRR